MTVRLKNPQGDTVTILKSKKSFDKYIYKMITRFADGNRAMSYLEAGSVDAVIFKLHQQGYDLEPLKGLAQPKKEKLPQMPKDLYLIGPATRIKMLEKQSREVHRLIEKMDKELAKIKKAEVKAK